MTTTGIEGDRGAAIELLHSWVESEALRRHCVAVEHAMRAYALERGGDPDVWGCVGLLHDFDWERHPTLEQHPAEGQGHLEAAGYPDWFRRAIMSHANHTGVARESDLEHHLFACDELCGFLHACGLVRPTGLDGITPKSVKKKLKDARFAAAVSRDDIRDGAEEIGRSLDDHIAFVAAALLPISDRLGLPAG